MKRVIRHAAFLVALIGTGGCLSHLPPPPRHDEFPTVPRSHRHSRALLANALLYATPGTGLFDPASGYPVEGWNNDPVQGLVLRSFTQLTSIGEWIELLSILATGQATIPQLSDREALEQLKLVMHSLRTDQHSPQLSDRGLLVNFLAFMPDHRDGPLAGDVTRAQFTTRFGAEKGNAIWNALAAQAWLLHRNEGRDAEIKRGPHYGMGHFTGALAPFDHAADRQAILDILDQRVVTIIFGDNANLSASVGKAIGTLLRGDLRNRADVIALRGEMETFLDAQREGYDHLYDRQVDRFFFGWDATRQQMVGWAATPAHNDYSINEFRGPTLFVMLRYGFPSSIAANMGSILRLYRLHDGSQLTIPAAWDGSAFQILGLGVMLDELSNPVWHALMKSAVTGMLDFSDTHGLPGLLSESYTGNGIQYTGSVGIPEMTVDIKPRIVTSPSLYALGAAHQVAPEQVEAFIGRHWPAISTNLLTDHGPWEGMDMTKGQPIRCQTAAHTMALALGLIGTGPDAMRRYLDEKGLSQTLDSWNLPGRGGDGLAAQNNVFAWALKGPLATERTKTGIAMKGNGVTQPGLAIVPPPTIPLNISGTRMELEYTSPTDYGEVTIQFKHSTATPPILNQYRVSLPATGTSPRRLSFLLPTTPGLTSIREVVFCWGGLTTPARIAMTFSRLSFTSY